MPLESGSSQKTISNNIRTLMHEVGKSPHVQSRQQAIAIAESKARGRAMGGVAPMMGQAYNPTGVPTPSPMPSGAPPMGIAPPPAMMPQMGLNAPMPGPGGARGFAAGGEIDNSIDVSTPGPTQYPYSLGQKMQDERSSMDIDEMKQGKRFLDYGSRIPGSMKAKNDDYTKHHGYAAGGGIAPIQKTFKGPIVSAVPGRTDKHFTHVPSGSYVIPADVVSGNGQGNTLAGMNSLHQLFKMGQNNSMSTKLPYGGNHLAKGSKFANGGHDSHVGKPVPVKLAGGEIVVSPEHVMETMSRICKKKMTLDECHRAMDKWVVNQRKKLRKTLAKLPGPARD